MKKKTGYLLLIIVLFFATSPLIVAAQTSAQVTLGSIDLSQFPQINTIMDVRNTLGYFMTGLNPEDVLIIEDGIEIQASDLIEKRVGAQVVVAINLGTGLNVIDENGIRRIDYVSEALRAWIGSTNQSIDRFSLLSTEGVLVNHTSDGEAWSKVLEDYQPEITVFQSWDVLSAALDLVSDPVPTEGMGRAVILITPVVPTENNEIIQSLADRARQSGVRLYIGLVDSSLVFESEEALQLQSLATQTGGQYFAFSGFETLPDINAMIESSRRIYQLTYNSQISTAGQHEFEIIIHRPNGDIRSGFEEISLDLRPPNPFFLSPPSEITRSIVDGLEIDPQNLFPLEESVQILIEFPDNIDREILHSALYINNEFVVENTEPPFTEFTFDLSGYEVSQQIRLRVEALDELGLIGSSIDTPIQIIVNYPEQSLSRVIANNINDFAIGISIFTGAMLLFILILGGQLKPSRFGDRLRKGNKKLDPIKRANFDLEPQVKNNSFKTNMQAKKQSFLNKLPWYSKTMKIKETAFLLSLSDEEGTEIGKRIPITSKEILIGSSTEKSSLRLDNAAVNELHARLWEDENGEFQLADLNSTAGTWLNYSKISSEGMKISHGDLFHIANLGFRFLLSKPPKTNQIEITQIKEN